MVDLCAIKRFTAQLCPGQPQRVARADRRGPRLLLTSVCGELGVEEAAKRTAIDRRETRSKQKYSQLLEKQTRVVQRSNKPLKMADVLWLTAAVAPLSILANCLCHGHTANTYYEGQTADDACFFFSFSYDGPDQLVTKKSLDMCETFTCIKDTCREHRESCV